MAHHISCSISETIYFRKTKQLKIDSSRYTIFNITTS
ncbi:unnamed protein product [Schistosoma curassoni]|uniref:Uncharacterized protein n=1 Tax=Schistosoma curassoni TaxID=6186 RepID=A0A183JME7_9TREM|nr:unnamed protein product [Schistosoma curassoni]